MNHGTVFEVFTMYKRIVSIITALLFSAGLALAQSGVAVKQSGNITPNTVPWWITSGVIGGGVTAADSPISSFGATGPICSNSARQVSGAWNSLCFQANANSPATISLQNYGSAAAQGLVFVVNGVQYPIPVGSTTPALFPNGVIGGGVLTSYYVATTGNDANTCLSITTPCLTFQGAWNKIAVANYGTGGAQLNVADGTYTGALNIDGAWNGAGPLFIIGNCSTPGNVISSVSGISNITVAHASVNISCMEMRNDNFVELLAFGGGDIFFSNMRFGVTSADQMQANGGRILGSGNYSIVGNMGSHGHSFNHGFIEIKNAVVTLVGNPTISEFFFGVSDASIYFLNSSFVGTAVGLKFDVHNNGIFNSGSTLGISGLPGTIAGVLDTNGQYDGLFVGDNTAWTAYSPNIASSTAGGTPATYTLNNARYKCYGKTCDVKADVTVTNQGVGAGGTINVDLPFTAVGPAGTPGSSYAYVPSAKSGSCFVGNSATKMTCIDSTGTTYIATGTSIVGSVTYEIP